VLPGRAVEVLLNPNGGQLDVAPPEPDAEPIYDTAADVGSGIVTRRIKQAEMDSEHDRQGHARLLRGMSRCIELAQVLRPERARELPPVHSLVIAARWRRGRGERAPLLNCIKRGPQRLRWTAHSKNSREIRGFVLDRGATIAITLCALGGPQCSGRIGCPEAQMGRGVNRMLMARSDLARLLGQASDERANVVDLPRGHFQRSNRPSRPSVRGASRIGPTGDRPPPLGSRECGASAASATSRGTFVCSATQSRKLERKPWTVASTLSRRRSISSAMFDIGRPDFCPKKT
jgi:hypothetical protein